MTETRSAPATEVLTHPGYRPPSTPRTAWLIARRAAVESLRDRNTALTNVLMVLVLPAVVVFALVVPSAAQPLGSVVHQSLGTELAIYLLVVGSFPSSGSVGIAAGVFAGEKEQDNLTPLLASPATNAAIFGGKVVGAILPPMLYAVIAEVLFLIELWLIVGQRVLALVPLPVYLLMYAMVPCYALLGASIASLISSRVRTYSAAQTYTGLLLVPVLGGIFALVIFLLNAPVWALALAVAGVALVDVALILVGAATWRREEVLAQR
jgi:ABC-2 type transport system permease protein